MSIETCGYIEEIVGQEELSSVCVCVCVCVCVQMILSHKIRYYLIMKGPKVNDLTNILN